jgi:hypothetical protein
MLTNACPVATFDSIVTSTTLNPCPNVYGQIQRLVFVRSGFTMTVASATSSTKWTTITTATGAAKAVFSPYIANFTLTPGDARSFGGGNETKDGAPIRAGVEPTEVAGRFYFADQATTATNFRQMETENLEVYFVTETGALVYSTSSTNAKGFPICTRSLSIKDLNPGDRQTPPYNDFVFTLPAQWSQNLAVTAATTFLLTSVNT